MDNRTTVSRTVTSLDVTDFKTVNELVEALDRMALPAKRLVMLIHKGVCIGGVATPEMAKEILARDVADFLLANPQALVELHTRLKEDPDEDEEPKTDK